MKKLFIMANAIMMTLILIFDICYMIKGGLLFKSVASIMFVLTGFINLIYCIKKKSNLKYPIWMIVALICAMLGDILLLYNFYLGAGAFAVGHIFYFVSYCMLEKLNCKDLLYGIVILLFSLFVLLVTPFLSFDSTFMHCICCAYAIIISFMMGKAISNMVKSNSIVNRAIAIGSILFFISDFMLMLDLFGGISTASYLCLGTYYSAQFLLAFSLFIHASTSFIITKK